MAERVISTPQEWDYKKVDEVVSGLIGSRIVEKKESFSMINISE